MTRDEVKKRFGFYPEDIGNRHRGYWLIEEPDDEDARCGVERGDLCVEARDGADNPIDSHACGLPNFRATAQDDFDRTYRYYFYRPLATSSLEMEFHRDPRKQEEPR